MKILVKINICINNLIYSYIEEFTIIVSKLNTWNVKKSLNQFVAITTNTTWINILSRVMTYSHEIPKTWKKVR